MPRTPVAHDSDVKSPDEALTLPLDVIGKGLDRLPLSAKRAQQLVDYLFRSRRYLRDPQHFIAYIERWRRDATIEGREQRARSAPAVAPAKPEWYAEALDCLTRNPQHWTAGRLAARFEVTVDAILAELPAAVVPVKAA